MFDQRRSTQNPYGRIVQFENREVQIEAIMGSIPGVGSASSKITGWIITDTNGTKYTYSVGNIFKKKRQ